MDRRTFLARAGVVFFAAPLAAKAQPVGKGVRIGLLWPNASPPRPPRMEAFRQGLSESGYVEGQNLTVELRFAEGGVERLPQLAAQLVHLNVQVVVTIGTLATSAVQRTATTIPIVALADELVRPGLVASVARPGGNTTGVQILAPEVSAKRLELLKQIVPVVSRVAVLSDPGQGLPQVPPLEEAARSLGVQLRVLEVRGEGDIEGAFQAAKGGRAGAIHVLASPRLFAYSKTIVGLAAKHRLPVIYEWREAVEAGGLASYGPILSEMWRQTARVVGKVLNGAKPADLPVEQPTKFELVINLKTAKALGLTIPSSVLARADEVIQ
jgi:putative tryptophan/tyrosine transport system substrate-binding protein